MLHLLIGEKEDLPPEKKTTETVVLKERAQEDKSKSWGLAMRSRRPNGENPKGEITSAPHVKGKKKKNPHKGCG